MKILLVRHGETDFNKNKLIQGHSDIVLNETGKEFKELTVLELKQFKRVK